MRKCYLCGAVLRRRAEFCRFCTARQPDAATPLPGTPVGPGGAVPPPWLLPAPPSGATSPGDRRSAGFQPTWDVIAEVRVDPPTEIEVEAVTSRADDAPARYDDPIAARALHPPTENPVLTDDPAPVTDDRGSAGDPVPGNGTRHTTDGRPTNGRPTNGRPANGTNGRPANGHAANGRATNGRPANGTNGRPANGRATNGTTPPSTNGSTGRTTEVVAATVASPPAPELDPSDPLLGFEHFPDAPPAPEIRWG